MHKLWEIQKTLEYKRKHFYGYNHHLLPSKFFHIQMRLAIKCKHFYRMKVP